MRSAVIACFILMLGISAVVGCGGGGSTSVGPPTSVVFPVSSYSLNPGEKVQVSARAKDASGNSVLSATISFSVTPTGIADVAHNGLMCAGTWDSTTTPVVCTPQATGVVMLSASTTNEANNITSTPIPVYVHPQIDSVQITALPPSGSSTAPSCISQGASSVTSNPPPSAQVYQATAFSNGVALASGSVGQFSWTSSETAVGVIPSTQPTLQDPLSQISVNPGTPGVSNITASIGSARGTKSTPANFTTCPVTQIALSIPNSSSTSFTVAANATQTVSATVTDSNGLPVTSATLNWGSSQPRVATVAVGTTSGVLNATATAVSPGTTSIVASCVPSSCNTGLDAIHSNLVTGTVSGTSAQTVYVTSSTTPASGQHNSIIPIDNNTAGTAIALPNDTTVNSLVFNGAGTAGYLGSNAGLIPLNPSNNTLGTTVSAVTGRVLAVSPDGNRVVVSDSNNSDPSKRKVYIFNAANNAVENTLNISNATAAAFTPGSLKAFIVAGSNVFIYSPTTSLVTHSLSSNTGNDVSVLASGQVALVAEAGVEVIATCRYQPNLLTDDSVTNISLGTPELIATIPNGAGFVDVRSPSLDQVDVTFANGGGGCKPSFSSSAPSTYTFGSSFVPQQLLLAPDSSKAFIVSDQGSLLVYTIGVPATNGSTSTIALAGSGTTPAIVSSVSRPGATTLDSQTVYVGGSDNAVHRIDLTANSGAGADAQQSPVSFAPDLVALRPK